MAKELINELMEDRVHLPIGTVEISNEAWDNVSENGDVFGNLSNWLVMFGAHLLVVYTKLPRMSIGDLELGCRVEVFCHGLFEQCHVVRESIRR